METSGTCSSTVDGHVVDSTSHEPVGGAAVTVDGRYVGTTDAAGRFNLAGLCPGERKLTVERIDCVPDTRTLALRKHASLEIELELVTSEVIEIKSTAPRLTDMRSTTTITGAELDRKRGQSFTETFADVPGVAQLKSASGMAKPIIRGQFGRRLLILVSGVRHRAQEWGIEHAPEIDPFVAGALTIVRGASGVRYGPDAIGGAVLVDPPPLLARPGFAGEAHLVGATNGLGGTFASRLQHANDEVRGLAWSIEGSYKRLASPSTPDYALDNTGVHEWNVGASVGYTRGNHEARLSYTHYNADLGVCNCLRVHSAEEFFANLDRDRPQNSDLYTSDAEIERPNQAVAHDLAIARDEYSIPNHGKLTTTLAFQHDYRREYDIVRSSVTGPQYSFRMFTPEAEIAYDHNPVHLTDHLHLRGTWGVTTMAQTHQYAGLQLVPDHQSFGAGIYAIERLQAHDYELEAGVRYDFLTRTASLERIDYLRLVREGQLAMDACDLSDPDKPACNSRYHTLSASIGGLYRLTDESSLKLDLSTASRPPNTDEQYINGTAPSYPVLGLGKPDLGAETTYSASLTGAYRDERVTAEASVFANYIDDYIYFAPAINAMGEPIFDVTIRGAFPRFVTRPVDAVFYGADGGVAVTPSDWLELGAQASLVRARNRTDDSYLVFIPPDRARGYVTLRHWNSFVSASGTFVRKQDRFDLAADFDEPPASYFLLGAELGTEMKWNNDTIKFALQGTNLTNARYRDYTSLLRYFSDQPGWQVMLRASVYFNQETK